MGQPYDGRQTDAWSFGVMLYAIMEGRLPFDPPLNSIKLHRKSRAAHRVARVEYDWYRYKKECASEWLPGKEIVISLLKRKETRMKIEDLRMCSWFVTVLPENLRVCTFPSIT